MNKNKYFVILVTVLSFLSFRKAVFAKDILTYSLNTGKMYIEFNAKKNIIDAAIVCNGSTLANFYAVNSKKISREVDISGKLTRGNFKCNINYTVEGNEVAQKASKIDIDVIITNPRSGSIKDNTCSAMMATDKTLEYNCKAAGCHWKNGTCSLYASDVNVVVPGNNSNNNSNGGNTNNVDESETPLDSSTFCEDISPGLKIAGYTIIIIKIITPLAIILMGSFDFYKAVSTGKQDDLKKQVIMLANRVLVGLIIFFLPTILKTALNFISGDSEYISCIDCLFDPTNSCK